MRRTRSPQRRLSLVLPLGLLGLSLLATAGACGGSSSGGDGSPGGGGGPDASPPTVRLDAPLRAEALIPGDTLRVTYTADDDKDATVRVVLDGDGDLSTAADQIVLHTALDANGAPVTLQLGTAAVPTARYGLFVVADDGVHTPVADGGTTVLAYPGLAGVAPPRRNVYGVVDDIVAFSVGEAAQDNTDLNGDGDVGDGVIDLLDTSDGTHAVSGLTVDVSGIVASTATARVLPSDTGWLAWPRLEADEGGPQNGDGDALDTLLGYARTAAVKNDTGGATLTRSGVSNQRVVQYSEPAAALDLNGDGDPLDEVVVVLDHPTNTFSQVFWPQLRPGSAYRGSWQGFGAYLVDELTQGPGNLGTDLNGDFDTVDTLLAITDVGGAGVVSVGPSNVDPTAAFSASNTAPIAVYYVDESLLGTPPINGDLDVSDFVPTVNLGGPELYPGTALNAGMGARFAFGDGARLFYTASEEGVNDWNGDGDTADTEILYFTDVSVSPTTATRVGLPGAGLTGIALDGGYAAHVSNGWLSLVVSETANTTDLNGDGDQGDLVFMLLSAQSGPPVVYNTLVAPLAPSSLPLPGATIPITGVGGGRGVLFQASEAANEDLNGDGDTTDTLAFYVEYFAPTTLVSLPDTGGLHAGVGAAHVAITAWEALTDTDFNGDGDTQDFVFRVFSRLGVVVDGERLSHQHSVPATRKGALWAWLRSEVAEQKDLNGDGDLTDLVLGIWLL